MAIGGSTSDLTASGLAVAIHLVLSGSLAPVSLLRDRRTPRRSSEIRRLKPVRERGYDERLCSDQVRLVAAGYTSARCGPARRPCLITAGVGRGTEQLAGRVASAVLRLARRLCGTGFGLSGWAGGNPRQSRSRVGRFASGCRSRRRVSGLRNWCRGCWMFESCPRSSGSLAGPTRLLLPRSLSHLEPVLECWEESQRVDCRSAKVRTPDLLWLGQFHVRESALPTSGVWH